MYRKSNSVTLILLFSLLHVSLIIGQKVHVDFGNLPDTLAVGDIVVLRPLPMDGNGVLLINATNEIFLPMRALMLQDTTKSYVIQINVGECRTDDYCQKLSGYRANILKIFFEVHNFFPSSVKYKVIGKGNSEAFFTFEEYINATGHRRELIYFLNNRVEVSVE